MGTFESNPERDVGTQLNENTIKVANLWLNDPLHTAIKAHSPDNDSLSSLDNASAGREVSVYKKNVTRNYEWLNVRKK